MKKVIGIILIIVALGLGYMGYQQIDESSASVEVAGIELSASDDSGKTQGFIMLGLALACLIGGVVLVGKKD